MTPTPEQLAVIEAARTTSDNLIIHALAGAAKTSTLVLLAKALPSTPILCLAFNVRIKDEMVKRLPGNCEALTLNSLGHRVWSAAIGRRLVVKSDKTYTIVSELINKLPPEQRSEAFATMADTMRAVDFGKTAGYVPSGKFPAAKPLIDDDELFADLEEEPTALQEQLIRAASFESIAQAMQGTIDYNDQILMPTVFHGTFPRHHKLILVDESQDLSALNHAMLRKLVKTRVIAVGDANQSIYGFRGAHADSMNLLQPTFSMRPFTLSVTFRCPQAVVREARWRTPHMKFPEWAAEGKVTTLDKWSTSTIPDGAVVLCRNNAPLFSCAIKMLRNGLYPELVGNDIGKMLIKLMKKLGPSSTPRDEAAQLVQAWLEMKLAVSRDHGKLHDQAECMRVFLEQGTTLGDAIAYAEHLMAVSGTIKLMTIHKAKGLEWNDVFILDKHLINLERTQEKNLLYVAITRAKETLTYLKLEGFEGV